MHDPVQIGVALINQQREGDCSVWRRGQDLERRHEMFVEAGVEGGACYLVVSF